jgi:hypothetical protein
MELWGAGGGIEPFYQKKAAGAYVSGYIHLRQRMRFKVFIGGRGTDGEIECSCAGGYNGGGDGGFSGSAGGGATDVRISDSFSSRIIVAAGAAGGERVANGHGGTLRGLNGSLECKLSAECSSTAGTQNSPGIGGTTSHGKSGDGGFGYGGNGAIIFEGAGGGGGGYYGGGAMSFCGSGSSGSSFISGYIGCDAITGETNFTHTGLPYHYSGLKFFESKMISGSEYMPAPDLDPDSQKTVKGNQNNGNFRLTIISAYDRCTVAKTTLFNVLIRLEFLLITFS